jgi:hypothetical protein
MTCYYAVQKAAQATFKSIKSLVPLFDRVLVQRFKPDTVRVCFFLSSFGFIIVIIRKRHRESFYRLRQPRAHYQKRLSSQ